MSPQEPATGPKFDGVPQFESAKLEKLPPSYFEPEKPLTKEEQESESLISLMSEIKAIQETNKDLPDEQRRQNAEQMMIKLASAMGLGDDYDPEDEDDDDKWTELVGASKN